MRSIRKMSIEFGLVSVPVKVYSACEDHDIPFHQFHADCTDPGDIDAGRIRYARTCDKCDKVVEVADIVRGTEHDGQVVFLTDDEIKEIDSEAGTGIEVLEFVPENSVDPIYFDGSYFTEPNTDRGAKGAARSYELLRQTMLDAGRHGVVRLTLRSRQRNAILRPYGDALAIHTLQWADEIRGTGELKLKNSVELDPKELQQARYLVDGMSVDTFDPTELGDDTRLARLQELIEAKRRGSTFVAKPKTAGVEDVTDLMAALEASIAAHPAGKGKGKTKATAKAKKSA